MKQKLLCIILSVCVICALFSTDVVAVSAASKETLLPPANPHWEIDNGSLTASFSPTANAESYLISVFKEGDSTPQLLESESTSLVLGEILSTFESGSYSFSVVACDSDGVYEDSPSSEKSGRFTLNEYQMGLLWTSAGVASWTKEDATSYTCTLYKNGVPFGSSIKNITTTSYDFSSVITESGNYSFSVVPIGGNIDVSGDAAIKSDVYSYSSNPDETVLDIGIASIILAEENGQAVYRYRTQQAFTPYSGSLVITGTTLKNTILIQNGRTTVTLRSLKMNLWGEKGQIPILGLDNPSTVRFLLEGENSIKGDGTVPEIWFEGNRQLSLKGTTPNASLTAANVCGGNAGLNGGILSATNLKIVGNLANGGKGLNGKKQSGGRGGSVTLINTTIEGDIACGGKSSPNTDSLQEGAAGGEGGRVWITDSTVTGSVANGGKGGEAISFALGCPGGKGGVVQIEGLVTLQGGNGLANGGNGSIGADDTDALLNGGGRWGGDGGNGGSIFLFSDATLKWSLSSAPRYACGGKGGSAGKGSFAKVSGTEIFHPGGKGGNGGSGGDIEILKNAVLTWNSPTAYLAWGGDGGDGGKGSDNGPGSEKSLDGLGGKGGNAGKYNGITAQAGRDGMSGILYSGITDANASVTIGLGNPLSDKLISAPVAQTSPFYITVNHAIKPGELLFATNLSLQSGENLAAPGNMIISLQGNVVPGQPVTLFHQPKSGSPEAYRAVVDQNLDASFHNIPSLSPFILVKGSYKIDAKGNIVPVLSEENPKTGDDFSIALWLTLLLASAGCIGLFPFKKKQEHTPHC